MPTIYQSIDRLAEIYANSDYPVTTETKIFTDFLKEQMVKYADGRIMKGETADKQGKTGANPPVLYAAMLPGIKKDQRQTILRLLYTNGFEPTTQPMSDSYNPDYYDRNGRTNYDYKNYYYNNAQYNLEAVSNTQIFYDALCMAAKNKEPEILALIFSALGGCKGFFHKLYGKDKTLKEINAIASLEVDEYDKANAYVILFKKSAQQYIDERAPRELIEAIQAGDVFKVSTTLKYTESSTAALIAAVNYGDPAIRKLIFDQKPALIIEESVVVAAIKKQDAAFVGELIQCGAKISEASLEAAVRKGLKSTVIAILAKGVEITYLAVMEAFRLPNTEILDVFVDAGVIIDQLLIERAINSRELAIPALYRFLQQKQKAGSKDYKEMVTKLFFQCLHARSGVSNELVKYLLQALSNLGAEEKGVSVLQEIVKLNNLELLEELFTQAAKLRYKFGQTDLEKAYLLAASLPNKHILMDLAAQVDSFNCVTLDEYRKTALMLATKANRPDNVRFLLDLGVNIDLRANDSFLFSGNGSRALDYAHEGSKCQKMLLDADVLKTETDPLVIVAATGTRDELLKLLPRFSATQGKVGKEERPDISRVKRALELALQTRQPTDIISTLDGYLQSVYGWKATLRATLGFPTGAVAVGEETKPLVPSVRYTNSSSSSLGSTSSSRSNRNKQSPVPSAPPAFATMPVFAALTDFDPAIAQKIPLPLMLKVHAHFCAYLTELQQLYDKAFAAADEVKVNKIMDQIESVKKEYKQLIGILEEEQPQHELRECFGTKLEAHLQEFEAYMQEATAADPDHARRLLVFSFHDAQNNLFERNEIDAIRFEMENWCNTPSSGNPRFGGSLAL